MEAAALGWALLTGAAMGVYYDVFRILRRVFSFGYAMILGQDILFWVSSGVGVFFGSMVVYQGQLRILFVVMALTGFAVYISTVGAAVLYAADFVISIIKKLCSLLLTRLLRPVFCPAGRAIGSFLRHSLFENIKKKTTFGKKREENERKKKNTA